MAKELLEVALLVSHKGEPPRPAWRGPRAVTEPGCPIVLGGTFSHRKRQEERAEKGGILQALHYV